MPACIGSGFLGSFLDFEVISPSEKIAQNAGQACDSGKILGFRNQML